MRVGELTHDKSLVTSLDNHLALYPDGLFDYHPDNVLDF